MAYLGLDIGSGSVGIAYSRYGDVAEPLEVVDARAWQQRVVTLLHEREITDVVVGVPRARGVQNPNMKRVQAALTFLQTCDVHVHTVDESNTTGFAVSIGQVVAERGRHTTRSRIDDVAAALILQRFLDIRRGGTSVLE